MMRDYNIKNMPGYVCGGRLTTKSQESQTYTLGSHMDLQTKHAQSKHLGCFPVLLWISIQDNLQQ